MSGERNVTLSQTSRRRLLRAVGGLTTLGVASGVTTDTVAADPGDQQWAFETGGEVRSSPTVVDGTVFFGSNDGNLYAVDAETGTEQWAFKTGANVISAPTVVDGTAFVGDDTGNLYAVDVETGSQQWVYETARFAQSSPTVVGGTAFVVSSFNENLDAVDADTGNLQWTFEIERDISSSSTVVDGTVFVGSENENLYAIDADTGEQEWAFETEDFVWSSPTVVDGTVFVGSGTNLYAVNADTGNQLWATGMPGSLDSSPTVIDGTVFIGSSNFSSNLYAIDADTGDTEWTFQTGDDISTSPTVADKSVFVGSSDGNLYAVDADTGEQKWAFETGEFIISSPTVVDGTVFFGSGDGTFYAVDAGVSGSSEGSRVLLGTEGHHSEWRYAEQSIDIRTPDSDATGSGESLIRNSIMLLFGGIGTAVIWSYLYRSPQNQSTGQTQTETADTTSENSAPSTAEVDDQSTITTDDMPPASEVAADRHLTAAEAAIETAGTAASNANFSAAADAYSEAISEYNSVLAVLDAGATEQRAEIEAAIDSARADLETVETRHDQRNEIIEALKPAERSFQEAIVAYIENNQTVARIRFRQARDAFEEVHETISESENNLLGSSTEVSVQPDRELSSTTLSELVEIPEPAVDALSDAGIETLSDFESCDEWPWTPATVEKLVADGAIEENLATTLTLLSWLRDNEGCEFNAAEAVARRQEQADYGFNHAS
ncbi:outer membrane protein assembly factor BamB family protein [Halonotius roseus]|uniref:Pyrrolo-quinoline quinone n=1 Tax=Halonotius roseus TaxID=2511997 RepID=A0A544QQW2_9EURY|nr:PQQ-binding-like beta-propeller repeat protein [Halonotius roseus]TQQ81834.1 pyrrolo-quinoline quinone [Halonotius roseus]